MAAALVVTGCAVLVASGVTMVVRWVAMPLPVDVGSAPVTTAANAPSWRHWLSRWAAVALTSGLVAGVVVAGAGGRLIMRLLALTSSESAGQITEAEATIGRVSVDGTLGFIVFAGAPFGLLSGVLYLAIGRVLPGRWIRGILFGLLLLVLGATRLDPLRRDNFDFNLVGPPGLAVTAFVALVLLHALLVVALDRRLSLAWLPEAAPPLPRDWRRNALIGGRVAVIAATLLALPGFVLAVADVLIQ